MLLCLVTLSAALTACGGADSAPEVAALASATEAAAAGQEQAFDMVSTSLALAGTVDTTLPPFNAEPAPLTGGGAGAASDNNETASASAPPATPPTADGNPVGPQAALPAAPQPASNLPGSTSGASAANCSIVPPIPPVPAGAKRVTDFGALPNDAIDDTVAIQQAFDKLRPGDWLVFPAGRYLISKSINLRVPGTTLYGAGATIHATNIDDQAIRLQADDTRIYSFTKTAVTSTRKGAPWQAGIAVFAENPDRTKKLIRNVVIQGNRIINAGAPGTPEANSAGSAGIILVRTHGFLIANNTVVRSLADGIHMTAGTRDGRVIGNTVRETGDDMIAVVSYASGGVSALNSAERTLSNWDTKKSERLDRNIIISGNTVSGQYWGRGITVVGGEGITVSGNKVSNTAHGAGIMIAREAGYQTYGSRNVRVENNTIEQVQTTAPPYDANNKWDPSLRTRQGGIEINSIVYEDEAADPMLLAEFAVRDVLLRNNTVSEVAAPGVRVGAPVRSRKSAVDPQSGATVTRTMQPGVVENIVIERTALSRIGHSVPLYIVPSGVTPGTVWCGANTLGGAAIGSEACSATVKPVIAGASLSCLPNGQTR